MLKFDQSKIKKRVRDWCNWSNSSIELIFTLNFVYRIGSLKIISTHVFIIVTNLESIVNCLKNYFTFRKLTASEQAMESNTGFNFCTQTVMTFWPKTFFFFDEIPQKLIFCKSSWFGLITLHEICKKRFLSFVWHKVSTSSNIEKRMSLLIEVN